MADADAGADADPVTDEGPGRGVVPLTVARDVFPEVSVAASNSDRSLSSKSKSRSPPDSSSSRASSLASLARSRSALLALVFFW